ncbi:hypothetical protein BpHYR1_016174 [Brachionus plicatilis]|uniref:RNA-directed DNA polymerase from mobile element jockey-like n=1 Tax=Brachionus plicatilis TaxID=10195 RepID=A0A3M7PFB7_BRAPC|nr:hypothetical protein BpHYR1_016174 [Brachionus plicatilis]
MKWDIRINFSDKYAISGKKGSLDEYRVCTKNVRKSVKEAIKAYELDNPKLLYAYINNRQQTKRSIRSIKSENGENVTDRKEIASILNRQFKSVFIVDDDKEMPEFNQRTHMEICGNCNIRGKFLPNRTATTWNLLPSYVVNAITVNGFKSKLDAHMPSGSLRRSK